VLPYPQVIESPRGRILRLMPFSRDESSLAGDSMYGDSGADQINLFRFAECLETHRPLQEMAVQAKAPKEAKDLGDAW
jgi:hypothetical protein